MAEIAPARVLCRARDCSRDTWLTLRDHTTRRAWQQQQICCNDIKALSTSQRHQFRTFYAFEKRSSSTSRDGMQRGRQDSPGITSLAILVIRIPVEKQHTTRFFPFLLSSSLSSSPALSHVDLALVHGWQQALGRSIVVTVHRYRNIGLFHVKMSHVVIGCWLVWFSGFLAADATVESWFNEACRMVRQIGVAILLSLPFERLRPFAGYFAGCNFRFSSNIPYVTYFILVMEFHNLKRLRSLTWHQLATA